MELSARNARLHLTPRPGRQPSLPHLPHRAGRVPPPPRRAADFSYPHAYRRHTSYLSYITVRRPWHLKGASWRAFPKKLSRRSTPGLLALLSLGFLVIAGLFSKALGGPPAFTTAPTLLGFGVFENTASTAYTSGKPEEPGKEGDCKVIFEGEPKIQLPCNHEVRAYVLTSSKHDEEDCCKFAGAVEWTIKPDGQGVTVIGVPGACALITATDEAEEGTYTVTATGSSPNLDCGEIIATGTVTVTKDCGCGDSPPIGDVGAGLRSVALQIRLGRYSFGKSVGALSLHEKYPTNLLATPGCLQFLFSRGTNYQCEVITNTAGIRQVRVAEGLANIVTNTTYKYYVEIYPLSGVSTNKDVNNLYSLSGVPLATLVVENPDGAASTNKLNITDGDGFLSTYEWHTDHWELIRGGSLSRNCKTTVITNNLRTVADERYGTNGLEGCTVRKYQSYAFGERLVSKIEGTASTQHSNYFEYHTNLSLSTTGLLKQAVRADGSWEILQYDTNRLKTNVIFGFLNQAPTTNANLARNIEYRYGTNAVPGAGDNGKRHPISPRCIIEYVQGHEVARTYKLYFSFEKQERRCLNPGALWNDASNLVTVSKWYGSGSNSNRLMSIEQPDGTMEIRDYGFYTETNAVAVMYGTNIMYRTNIVYNGVPNAGKTAIVDGTKSISVWGRVGQMVSRTAIDIASGITNYLELHSDYDAYNRPRKVMYLDGTFSWTDYGCCGPTTVTNREGTVISYYRNALKHNAATTQSGMTTTNVLNASGRVTKQTRIGSNGSQIVQATHGYDVLGKLIASTNALGQRTTFSEGITNFLRTTTVTYPDGGTRGQDFYRNGQLAKTTGTAVRPRRFEFGTEEEGGIWRLFSKEIKLDGNGSDTSEWIKTYQDMLGRSYKTVLSDGASHQSFYNLRGQLTRQTDADGNTMLFAYNAKGEQTVSARDLNRDGVINTNGTDRMQQSLRSVTSNASANVQREVTYVWATNNVAISNQLSVTDTSVDGLISWHSQNGLTNQIRTKYAGNGNRYVTNAASDGSSTISHYADGLLQNVTTKDSAGMQLSKTTYVYDEHRRNYAITDARNGTTLLTYNDADRVVSTTTPSPGNGAAAQTTAFEHDWAGRVIRTVLPDGMSLTNEYELTGQLKKTYGGRTYPVQYAYDAQGRRTNMITWKNFAADSGKATTTWQFNGYRGFLTNKVYDDGKGPSYTYTPAGRLRTRTWARGVTTTYHTNALGETFATTYSDSTPAVTNNFDRLGRATNVVDGAGNRFLIYTAAGLVLHETNSSGTLIGENLRFGYDQLLRRTNLQLYATNVSLLGHSYTFDGASRMTNISDGTYQAGYSYLANSRLISQITYRSNSTTRMTTSKSYDFLDRLGSITSQPGGSGVWPVSFSYAYNDANQRTRVTMDDGSLWIYEYNVLGQLTSGKRYWSDWTPVAGQQYEYSFDDIGNRSSTKAGGNENGTNLRSATYSANALNQYTSRDVPGAADVIGIAHASAVAKVNDQAPYRRGEYFRKELSIDNSSGAVWQVVSNYASLIGTNQTNIGHIFLPKTAENYTYDADGNLTSDGRWTNTWDAENRLIDVTSHSTGPSSNRKSVQFAYDSQGRRYSKIVSNWTGSAWTRALHEKFLSDGWNLVGVLNGTNDVVSKTFLWGLDLAGSLWGAGGVGGLIAIDNRQAPVGTHFVAYDGNGNVRVLVAGDTGNPSACYEYDPFGQTIRASGTASTLNPVRFSSKQIDDETDMVFFGYRFLDSSAGRWLSRDPIGEHGRSLYCFANNAPLSYFDKLGLDEFTYDIAYDFNGDINSSDWPKSDGDPVEAYTEDLTGGTRESFYDFRPCLGECFRFPYKMVEVLHFKMTFQQGVDPDKVWRTADGRTISLINHEDSHVQSWINNYYTPLRKIYHALRGLCITSTCLDAWVGWEQAAIQYYEQKEYFESLSIDVRDYNCVECAATRNDVALWLPFGETALKNAEREFILKCIAF